MFDALVSFVYRLLVLPRPLLFFFNDTATTEIYTLSLPDALPISFVDITLNGSHACTRLGQQQHRYVALSQFADYSLDRPHAGTHALQKRGLVVSRIGHPFQEFASI